MRHFCRRAAVLSLAALAGACAREATPSTFTTTDSAGIVVAVSTGRAWDAHTASAWTLDPSPILDLTTTGNGPAHEFYLVADATRLADGRILVADRGSSQVRLYSPEGASIGATGGKGDGPGEYRQISSVHAFMGDSIVVYSWPTRLTVLGPDLAFGRTFSLGDRARELHVLDDGFLAMLIYASVLEYEGESRMIREPAPVVRFSIDGRLSDTIAVAPGPEEFMYAIGDQSGAARPLFGKTVTVGVGAGRVVLGGGERMAFSERDLSGALFREVRVQDYSLAVSAADIQAERDALLPPDSPPWRRDLVAALPAPETRPAYTELRVDSEGCVWAGAYQSLVNLDEPRKWEIFDPDGAWLGTLATPARFKVFEIGKDYVLGRRYDELDVEHVQVLRLTRRGG